MSDFGKRIDLLKKLSGVRDLKKILETTVKEIAEAFNADVCQIMLSNPLDANVNSICEFKQPGEVGEYAPVGSFNIPLVLHGRTLGSLSLNRQTAISHQETNEIRVILGELNDLIRHAQINDVVQRDTFRETFLVEIANLMAYSLGIGDALFMVVNILGKALQASRCLFICTDDTQAGWKCFEFWQQEKVQSCQDYRWPTTDSPVIAQTLLSAVPLAFYEGQQNSYVSPVQEELQFIGVKSLLGIRLRSSEATHGCVILQQCDYRRAWTRGEIDMAQNVADKVATALLKLPAEKRAREPIMQLHQRIVAVPSDTEGDGFSKIENVRRALKGALGQQAIPSARPAPKPKPPQAKPAPLPAGAQPGQQVQPGQPVQASPAQPAQPAQALPGQAPGQAQGQAPGQAGQQVSPLQASAPQSFAPPPANAAAALGAAPSPPGAKPAAPGQFDDLDFGEIPEVPATQQQRPPVPLDQDADRTWDKLQAMPPGAALTPNGGSGVAKPPSPGAPPTASPGAAAVATPPPASPAVPNATPTTQVPVGATAQSSPSALSGAPSNVPADGGKWGNLETIPTPASAPGGASPWGDLDSIPAPAGAPGRGLGGGMLGKARASSAARPMFNRNRAATLEPAEQAPPAPAAPLDEAAQEAKLKEIMAKSNVRSDFVFATPGLDMRVLGRIDNWITEIEGKDAFEEGHVRQTTEYALAIARECGMAQDQLDRLRQAALVHDVGKLGSPASLLQKPEAKLEDTELLAVMKHPIAGAELLQSFPDLKHLAPIVLTHREEFNGEGYPQGLKGNEIPVEARIIAVANGYHCLVSKMKHGSGGMAPEAAQTKLVEESGKKYDPMYVTALLQAIMTKKVPPVC